MEALHLVYYRVSYHSEYLFIGHSTVYVPPPTHTHTHHAAMAGNIIPAIATTNAVIAGIIVMEALKVLAGESHKCKTVSASVLCTQKIMACYIVK